MITKKKKRYIQSMLLRIWDPILSTMKLTQIKNDLIINYLINLLTIAGIQSSARIVPGMRLIKRPIGV